MITFKVTGMENVNRLLSNINYKLPNSIRQVSKEFMADVQKSAKLRAQRGSTGFMAENIRVYQEGENTIVLDTGRTPYAYFQEFGFKPHIIPVQYMEMHYSTPGARGQRIPRSQVSGFVLVKKSKPFLFPALNAALTRLPNKLSQAVTNTLK